MDTTGRALPPTYTSPSKSPPAPLLSSFAVKAAAGEPFAVVRVRNLAGSLPVGRDAWGRPNKVQPALLTTEVSFAAPFGRASVHDTVEDGDTAHYGNLSKNLLGSLDQLRDAEPPRRASGGSADTPDAGPTSSDAFDLLWVSLTGRVVDGSRSALPLDRVPFLDVARLKSLALTLHLPKASLLGTGVSRTVTACFNGGQGDSPLQSYARSLRIQGLHVPTLVGVNANERTAKQMVVADVEIDRLDVTQDIHPEVERLVVDVMSASSYETLEALGTHLADEILSKFKVGSDPKPARERGWQVKICLDKPIAVPFADSPAVEVNMGAGLP